uniref:Major facilitator superfamily (MFS) profile domain-containing protein n=1 Tax=Heliothis virescens TaxID=7102 RepID=A0A2A4KAA8_HELVI
MSFRYGRKNPLLVAVVIQIGCGVAAAYVSNFWLFTILRFLIGTSVGGTMVTTFVMVMEFVGTQYRSLIAALYQVPFNFGHMTLPIFAYFNRDYSDFQLSISAPVVILLCYFCLVPESPRWLLAVKRTEEAIKVLTRAAKTNNMPTDTIRSHVEAYQASLEKNTLKKGNLLDLFRTPNLRKNIIAMAFNWLTCSYCFYGVSQYVGQLSGNVFINVASSASVTLLGTLASIPLLKYLGRKLIVIIFHLVCASCLLTLSVLPAGQVVRNAALGFSSMAARIGSMIAPFVIGLEDKAEWMPPVAFGVMPLIAAAVTFLLPETRGCELTTTIQEGEDFGKKKPTT